MRVFAVLYCFPPLLVPATMCYLKLVVGLKELGHDVEVLTIVPESFRAPGESVVDPSLNSLVPEGLVRHEVWSWENNRLLNLLRERRFIYRLGYRFWEPRKKEWVFPALRLVKSLDFSGFDVVLTCSQPHSNHLIGLHLKRKLGIPWVAYFSDPWSDMPWQDRRSGAVIRYNLRLEREVVEAADTVLFTSTETVNFVMKKYPAGLRNKVGVLPHSFVPAWYGLNHTSFPARRARVEILHTGHFYGDRTPLAVFRALKKLSLAMSLEGELHLTFVGGMPERYRRYLTEEGLDALVTVHDTLPYLESLALMSAVDYLLVVDAPLRNSEESVFLPSKLIDYLGSEKPVLGVTPERGTTARVLRETGNSWSNVDNEAEIAALFASTVSGNARGVSNRQRLKEYHYLTTSTDLSQHLQLACKRNSRERTRA